MPKEAAVPETTDPRPFLFDAYDQAVKPTPCSEFDLKTLVEHTLGAARRVPSVGRHEPQGELDTEVAGGAYAAAMTAASDDVRTVWGDDALLTEHMDLGWGAFDGSTVARVYAQELIVHAWDIAASIGVTALLDPALAEGCMVFAEEFMAPFPRGGEMPFEAIVPVPADASAYEKLAGFLGRQPSGPAAA
jgi:uncharacterized protein (TIGR03086 family)